MYLEIRNMSNVLFNIEYVWINTEPLCNIILQTPIKTKQNKKKCFFASSYKSNPLALPKMSSTHPSNVDTASSLESSMKDMSNIDGEQTEKFLFTIGQILTDSLSKPPVGSQHDDSKLSGGHLSSGHNLSSCNH